MQEDNDCPCCSSISFALCCGKHLLQGVYPQNAEALMRSRFTAYVRNDIRYLTKTWHPDTCPILNTSEIASTHWIKLEVISSKAGLKKSTVEFKAYFSGADSKINDDQVMHELSEFRKIKTKWVYYRAITEGIA